ncbi:MAG: hypothetical protein DDT37_01935 [Firmicutes bacterium]|nr:hypothetical protein [candidate division NPL-UPA2 bacterium]
MLLLKGRLINLREWAQSYLPNFTKCMQPVHERQQYDRATTLLPLQHKLPK